VASAAGYWWSEASGLCLSSLARPCFLPVLLIFVVEDPSAMEAVWVCGASFSRSEDLAELKVT
jgi:hypothetical protein